MSLDARFRVDYPGFTLDVDVSLPGRGVSALFGVSGSGKSTLLRCIAGLEPAARGRLIVNGETWQDGAFALPTHRRPVGVVFQDAALFPHIDVRDNLRFGWRRVPAAQRRVSLDEAVDLLGIAHLQDRLPENLSGGERQRVAIARALAVSPRLLLLDEPLAALDAPRKRDILPYLERLHTTLDIPVVYVSHAVDEVARLADHVLVLDGGRVHASGPLTAVMARADLPLASEEDLGVVIAAPVVAHDPPWHLAQVQVGESGLWVRDTGVAIGTTLRVRVLARDVSLALQRHADTSIQNTLPGTVTALLPGSHPAVVMVQLDSGGVPLLARLTARAVHALALAPGKPVWIQVKSAAVIG